MELLLALAGVGIGASFGAVGAGGAVLAIPALALLGGVNVKQAMAAAPWLVVVMAAWAGAQDWRASTNAQSKARLVTALTLGLPGVPGALAGAWLNGQLSPGVLSALFFGLVLWSAWRMLQKPGQCVQLEGGENTPRFTSTGLAVGFGLGALSGLLGVGGGFLAVPLLVLLFGFCAGPAARISVLLILLNGLWAVLGHLLLHGADLHALRAMAFLLAGGLAGIPLGRWVRGHAPEVVLRRGFAGVLALSAAAVLWRGG